jgi:hypothetical protein
MRREKPFESPDDQFDLRTFQTASMATQYFAKISRIIAFANGFSIDRTRAGISSRFGQANEKPACRLKVWRGSS